MPSEAKHVNSPAIVYGVLTAAVLTLIVATPLELLYVVFTSLYYKKHAW
jgi:ABC-type uncharacterized transport system permease subunit